LSGIPFRFMPSSEIHFAFSIYRESQSQSGARDSEARAIDQIDDDML
jgi:hypothetical protein